jgi:hypothetical protein
VLRVFERCRHGIGGYSHAAHDELSFVLCRIVEVPVTFPMLDGHRACSIRVPPAVSPIFVKPPGT